MHEPDEGVIGDGPLAAGEMLADLDPLEVARGLADTLRPAAVAREALELLPAAARVAAGRSDVSFPDRDWRFADPAWEANPVYRRVGQAYLLWAQAITRLADRPGLDDGVRERARFAAALLTSAMAPTNVLAGNPAALKHAFDTGGVSLVRGLRNLARDVLRNGGMPAQVDERPFELGGNLAATPGAVVHREEICEVIQYAPATARVRERPLLMIPPEINKHYFVDLAPGRSFVEWAVAEGVQYFTIVWRNPREEHGHWGMDDYLGATLRATDVVREITGIDDLNLFGLCAGGVSLALLLGHLAAVNDTRARSAMLAICMLDFSRSSVMDVMTSERIVRRARARAERGGVLPKEGLAHSFAWLRPNDLVWNYVVNDWLMGKDPPAFDVLAWNNDPTALSRQLHADLVELFSRNALAQPGAAKALGTPVDLGAVTCDSYVVAGRTDHITPWRPGYASTRLLGGESEFVLTSTGHIQSIVNPPGKARARFHAGRALDPDPDAWLRDAREHEGSWWPHWREWILARSGREVPAPTTLGGDRHPPGEPAPGRYVRER
jgi:poly[(R)-3-hydroxyalkanoate] polymerase subunit PhaC